MLPWYDENDNPHYYYTYKFVCEDDLEEHFKLMLNKLNNNTISKEEACKLLRSAIDTCRYKDIEECDIERNYSYKCFRKEMGLDWWYHDDEDEDDDEYDIENKFNIGDTVRIINCDHDDPRMEQLLGTTAKIIDYDQDEGGEWWYDLGYSEWEWLEAWLELV